MAHRVLEVVSGSSPVVDDVATFVDLEHGLEFAVTCRRKVYLDAQITLSNQVEATAVATVEC